MARQLATIAISILILVVALPDRAHAVSIELTTDALGLGSVDINRGKTVDPDIPGSIITSPTVGQGSILTIQSSGVAGPGTAADPLLVTLTARTHLDTTTGLPTGPNDVQAGVLYISKRGTKGPQNDGLGVRAFAVDGTGSRLFGTGASSPEVDSALARIEGSKDVSGGTGPDTFDPASPNGAPHVDEDVLFDFNPALNVGALGIEVLLSKFVSTDIIDLHIKLTSGTSFDFPFLQTTDASLTEVSTQLWKLRFSALGVFGADDQVDQFIIRANDDLPATPKGTAEHFLINGLTATPTPPTITPEPASIVLSLLGLGALGLYRHRHRSVSS